MRVFGLIGYPLSHSFSKKFFTEKFQQDGITDCRYENFPIASIAALPALLAGTPGLEGINITIPYKEAVIPFLDGSTAVVKEIGACNCIRIQGGKLVGHNTDVTGFRLSLEPGLKPHHRHALILGTGGAAKAVAYVLEAAGIDYRYVSTKLNTGNLSYQDLDRAAMEHYTLIINTTPLGMYPNIDAAPGIPYQFVGPEHYLFDLVYNPAVTLFLQNGATQGATIKNGADMLEIQALESWKIWNNQPA